MEKNARIVYEPEKNIFGYPQTFKNIKFHPIRLKEVRAQTLFYQLFGYAQRYIPDKKVLKMSYLKFLLYVAGYFYNKARHIKIIEDIKEFFQLITRSENVSFSFKYFDIPGEIPDKIGIFLEIDGVKFSEQDFDVIREIVLAQNGLSVDYIESYNPELEKHLEFVNNRFKDLTFEDEIYIFCSLLHKSINEVEDYTIYQFKKHFERMLMYFNYTIYSPLEISGQIKSKTGGEIVAHFMAPIKERGRYDSILISVEEFLKSHPDIPSERENIHRI